MDSKDLGPIVKPLSAHTETIVPEATYLDVKLSPGTYAPSQAPKPGHVESTDVLKALDEFSITLKGSHCVYGLVALVVLGIAMYLWHLNARIQSLEALIIAAAGVH